MNETVRSDHPPRPAQRGDLLLVTGNGYFATHVITGDELVIGRDPSCDVVIDDDELSRRHACLRLGPPLTIQDLGSTNGTRVGGVPHHGGAPIGLMLGGGFEIGPYMFMIGAGDRTPVRASAETLRVDDAALTDPPPLVRDIAASTTSVLILGETGAGKDVLANALHRLSGRTGAIARINCAALSETLIESELFGHEKGAFTGAVGSKLGLLEAAIGGTVFLDEIGELPATTQAKLLRALESREITRLGSVRPIPIDVRFIAATNRDLPAEVTAGRFRADLYFRLDGITLYVPPLRERAHQIVPLAASFLADALRAAGRPVMPMAIDVAAALETHDWPGNVRELKAVIERAVVLSRGGPITRAHLAFAPRIESRADGRGDERIDGRGDARPERGEPTRATGPLAAAPPDLDDDTDDEPATPLPFSRADADALYISTLTDEQREERARYVAALDRCAGNQTRAARELGVSRTTLVSRIRLYRIPRPRT